MEGDGLLGGGRCGGARTRGCQPPRCGRHQRQALSFGVGRCPGKSLWLTKSPKNNTNVKCIFFEMWNIFLPFIVLFLLEFMFVFFFAGCLAETRFGTLELVRPTPVTPPGFSEWNLRQISEYRRQRQVSMKTGQSKKAIFATYLWWETHHNFFFQSGYMLSTKKCENSQKMLENRSAGTKETGQHEDGVQKGGEGSTGSLVSCL